MDTFHFLRRFMLLGAELGKVANPDTMRNPRSLDFFIEYAKTLENASFITDHGGGTR
ncbi:hypothetical protein [Cupriavidus necator]